MVAQLDAARLKKRYSSKWRLAARREQLVVWLLNRYYMLPSMGYVAILSGLGSGTADYLPRSYSSAEEAFDIIVASTRTWKPVAFIDATGVASPQELQEHKGLCVGLWKLWKAEKHGLEKHRVWIVHVEDDGPRLRWQQLSILEEQGTKHKLRRDERPLLCLDPRKWKPTQAFIKWLMAQRGG